VKSQAHLLVYRFGPDADYEGRLVGALERIEVDGGLRVLDILFVASAADSGEIFAATLGREGAGGKVASLIGFRLDVERRRQLTRRALAGGSADLIAALGKTLEPGDALAAVLVGHDWARAFDDAVTRTGGAELANTFVEAESLTSLTRELLDLAGSARAG